MKKIVKRFRLLLILVAGIFASEGTLADPAPREKAKTEIVVGGTYGQVETLKKAQESTQKQQVAKQVSPPTYKKFVRNAFLGLLIVLALCGIPVVPPKRLEQDVDNETKTELVEGSESSEEKN